MLEIMGGIAGLGIIAAIIAYFRGRITSSKNARQKQDVDTARHQVKVEQARADAAQERITATEDRRHAEENIAADPVPAADKLRDKWSRD